jgi:hypothetical protein
MLPEHITGKLSDGEMGEKVQLRDGETLLLLMK